MDERQLTLIVVPHGDLETRTFVISYRRLRLLLGVVAGVLLVICTLLALWFPTFAQAARVATLERELQELEQERAKVAELAQTLAEVEAQYEKVRRMLGADAPVNGEAPVLPPLRDTVPSGRTSSTGGSPQGMNSYANWPAVAPVRVAQPLPGDSDVRNAGQVDRVVPKP